MLASYYDSFDELSQALDEAVAESPIHVEVVRIASPTETLWTLLDESSPFRILFDGAVETNNIPMRKERGKENAIPHLLDSPESAVCLYGTEYNRQQVMLAISPVNEPTGQWSLLIKKKRYGC